MPRAELDETFERILAAHLESVLGAAEPGRAGRLEFSLGRLREGRKVLDHLRRSYPRALDRRARVLDLGCGNGGLLLPFAEAGHRATALDVTLHPELAAVAREMRLDLELIAAEGGRLPFADAMFDVVLLAETIEHLTAPRAIGAELARVLRPGGIVYVTTPPRLRFLVGRDPHYGVPGLLLLPDRLQRRLFERWLAPGAAYGVVHTFWTARGVLACLPGLELAEISSKHWSGPLRRLDWDWIVARKPLSA